MKKLTDYKWLNLFEKEFLHKDGKIGHWTFASRKEIPSFNVDQPDVVIIVPIHKETNKLVLIKEFRYPIDCFEWGFPAGLVETGESVTDVAIRELKEETNLDVTEIIEVSSALVSSAGLSDESVSMVFVYCSGTPSNENNEGSENINIKLLDLQGISYLLQQKGAISAKCWPILRFMLQNGRIDWQNFDKPISHTVEYVSGGVECGWNFTDKQFLQAELVGLQGLLKDAGDDPILVPQLKDRIKSLQKEI